MKIFINSVIIIFIVVALSCVWYNKGVDDTIEVFEEQLKAQLEKTPSAMDVYNGKTTLKYTIVDGVKTDSTVIFKNY